MRLSLQSVVVLGLAAAPVCAQGTITDANASFSFGTLPTSMTSTGGTANFSADPAVTDTTFQSWWYYRDAAGAGGALNNSGGQLTQNYAGNAATLNWTDVDAQGLYDAQLTLLVESTGPISGRLTQSMQFTNRTSAPQSVRLYHYVDFDHNNSCCGSTGDWTLPNSGPDRFLVTDAGGGCVEHWAQNPDAYQVGTFSGIRAICIAGTPLANSGIPFAAPGAGLDYTGAFEWTLNIPANGSVTVMSVTGHNDLHTGTPGAAINYGSALGNAGGVTPTISSSVPVVGAPLTVNVNAGSFNGQGIVMLGVAPTALPVCGVTINVISFVDLPVTMTSGAASIAFPGVCDLSLNGLSLYWQAILLDPTTLSTCLPVIHSDGLQTTFGD